MLNLLSHLEEIVRTEMGAQQLASARAIASEHHVGHDPAQKAIAFARAAAGLRGATPRESYAFLAQRLVPPVLKALPMLIRANPNTLSVLMHLNQIVPAALDALLPGVAAPEFDIELLDLESLRLRFRGSDAVGGVVEGVVVGVASHYDERAETSWPASPPQPEGRQLLEVAIRPLRRGSPTPPRGR